MFNNNQKLNQFKQELLLRFQPLLQTQWFYLLGILASLAALHLNMIVNHPIEGEEVTFYFLYWAGILFLFWQNRQQENTPTWFSSLLGVGLLLVVLLRPLYLWYLDLALFRFGPIIAGLGIGILAFGFLGLRHHWRLFVLLVLMLFPFEYLNSILDQKLHLSELTAAISAFSLHYIGFEAISHGAFVKLPTGEVEVLYFCTGGLLIFWLLKLTLLIIVVVFPLTWRQRWGLVLSAIGTGFLIGCVRVSLLALIVHKKSLFHFWHSYTGGSIFMAIATLIYAFLCNCILPLDYLSPRYYKPDYPFILLPQRRLFLISTWMGIILLGFYSITSKQLLTGSFLPDRLTVHNWQQSTVNILPKQQIDSQEIYKYPQEKSAKYYSYLQNNQQIQLQMRYVVNSRGGANPFLEKLSKGLIKETEKNVRQIKGVGYYTLYSDSKQAYLTACINPRGTSTVNSPQFIQNRYKYDLTGSRLISWVFGKAVLRDDRCVWAQLSAPLNGVLATNIYTMLESVWMDNSLKWQTLFFGD